MQNIFKISKIGDLKYNRLKSISILKEKLKLFNLNYNYSEVKKLIENIINENFDDKFNTEMKYCLDSIFKNNEYIEFHTYEIESNFPKNYIPPIAH
jgi:hypothetical protein